MLRHGMGTTPDYFNLFRIFNNNNKSKYFSFETMLSLLVIVSYYDNYSAIFIPCIDLVVH